MSFPFFYHKHIPVGYINPLRYDRNIKLKWMLDGWIVSRFPETTPFQEKTSILLERDWMLYTDVRPLFLRKQRLLRRIYEQIPDVR